MRAIKAVGSAAGSAAGALQSTVGNTVELGFGVSSALLKSVAPDIKIASGTSHYDYEDIPASPFLLRTGNRVTLYQDAHCSGDFAPKLMTDSGELSVDYVPEDCFEAIYKAILNAKRFVYITGWSVDTKISLTRRTPIFTEEGWPVPSGMMTMGELLNYKASQGVKVLLHIWDEALSVNFAGFTTNGVMATYDEETKAFFQYSGVDCKLSYRLGAGRDNQFLWTHHQKSVIVDDAVLAGTDTSEDPDAEGTAEDFEEFDDGEETYAIPTEDGHRFVIADFMTCEHKFEKVVADTALGIAVFRPVPPEDYFILGDIALRTSVADIPPTVHVFVVKEPPAQPDQPTLLVPPAGYDLAWPSAKEKISKSRFSYWKPIAPEGYVALGYVAWPRDCGEPELENLRCVHLSAVADGEGLLEEDHKPLWIRPSKEAVWGIRPITCGLLTGCFAVSNAGAPCPNDVYVLRRPPAGVEPVEKPDDHEAPIRSFHQKPCDWGNVGKRRVIAFVGGLDLTYGRWDTPKHPMWRTLGLEHKEDFLHGWANNPKYGPREGWHDIHSKLEGPIARDVLVNFEQRWRKQAKRPHYHLGKEFISIRQEEIRGPEEWNCRLLRSIDLFSADIKGVEAGIQKAYIDAIRSADRFLYLENQYFMGSAKYWPTESSVICSNLIPHEIASRICEAIGAGKRFTAYIVLPMYPEGYPTDGAIQEQLRWQFITMRMMYEMIAFKLQSEGLDSHPTDYLNFFCLGQRESLEHSTARVRQCPRSKWVREKALWTVRRCPIYVHSKMMIVDDDYVVLGSANINERSMAGNRDSEICVENFQPAYRGKPNPRGGVHQFRMSLWTEHTNVSVPQFLAPESLECVQEIHRISKANWKQFMANEIVDMESHLMPYPIKVDKKGTVTAKVKYFPDTKAPVTGTSSLTMPDNLTT